MVSCDVGATLNVAALFGDDDYHELVTYAHNETLGDVAFNARVLDYIRPKDLAK